MQATIETINNDDVGSVATEAGAVAVAHVIVALPMDRVFSYTIPAELLEEARPGCRVLVSFGSRLLTGMIVEVTHEVSVSERTKPLLDVLDEAPSFSPELLELTRWISEYYVCSWGEAARAALPSGIDREHEYVIHPPAGPASTSSNDALKAILSHLYGNGPCPLRELRKEIPGVNLSMIRRFEREGLLVIEAALKKPRVRIKKERFIELAPAYGSEQALRELMESLKGVRQRAVVESLVHFLINGDGELSQKELLAHSGSAASTLKTLVTRGVVELIDKEVIRTPMGDMPAEPDTPPVFELHDAQQRGLNEIVSAIDAQEFRAFLLHGVTGSGKTEVYIAALKRVLRQGKTGIVLVPEIALTPQTVARFRAHFGDRIAVLHSRMSLGERYDTWRQLRSGRYSVAIGPRSAILAPLSNIGLVVVDEEHEGSYKQYDPAPRYHARDVAVMRASMNNAVCILGSATPSLESFVNAKVRSKYVYLPMKERVPVPGHDAAPLPTVHTIDLTREKRRRRLPGALSEGLKNAISSRLSNNEQVILLQNRRGYATVLECQTCGWVPTCNDCAVTLTYHKTQHHVRCHYCGKTEQVSRRCPQCGGTSISRIGAGTQRVEEELDVQFPDARILRMDLDTTSGKNAHYKILDQFARGKADILIGTQMVAKGLDFGRVTLVGVINADVGMLLPDFRAEERTFQLLTQVAGRAGRAELRGEVFLQTRNPKHPVLRLAMTHDYDGFARYALAQRKELRYPPYGRIIRVEFKGLQEDVVDQVARAWAAGLKPLQGVQVMGPQPAVISRIQKFYRFHVILKCSRQIPVATLRSMITEASERSGSLPRDYRMIVDVDAISLF